MKTHSQPTKSHRRPDSPARGNVETTAAFRAAPSLPGSPPVDAAGLPSLEDPAAVKAALLHDLRHAGIFHAASKTARARPARANAGDQRATRSTAASALGPRRYGEEASSSARLSAARMEQCGADRELLPVYADLDGRGGGSDVEVDFDANSAARAGLGEPGGAKIRRRARSEHTTHETAELRQWTRIYRSIRDPASALAYVRLCTSDPRLRSSRPALHVLAAVVASGGLAALEKRPASAKTWRSVRTLAHWVSRCRCRLAVIFGRGRH